MTDGVDRTAQLAIADDGSLQPAPPNSEQQAHATQESLFTAGPTMPGQLAFSQDRPATQEVRSAAKPEGRGETRPDPQPA